MKRIHGRVLVGVSIVIIMIVALLTARQVRAQDDVVADLTARLTQQGVPLSSIKIASRVPFRIEAIIQSESTGEKVASSDPLFIHAIEREVALARPRYGIGLDWVKVIIVNVQGEPSTGPMRPVRYCQTVPPHPAR